MESRHILCALLCLSACGPKLKDSQFPDPSQLEPNIATQGNSVDGRPIYSRDSTYKQNPEFWLGKVGFARKDGGSCSDAWQVTWESTIFAEKPATPEPAAALDASYALGFPVSTKSAPELRASALITQKIAASINALTYLGGELAADLVYELLVTDITSQRIGNSRQWTESKDKFKKDKAAEIGATEVCAVFVVSGYTHKTIVKKLYQKTDAKTSAGYAGIKIEGSYFNEKAGYQLDHLFELSVDYLKPPPPNVSSETATKLLVDELAVRQRHRAQQQQQLQQQQQQQQQQIQQQMQQVQQQQG